MLKSYLDLTETMSEQVEEEAKDSMAAEETVPGEDGKTAVVKIEDDGRFRNDLFEKFSFVHHATVNAEPDWLKVPSRFICFENLMLVCQNCLIMKTSLSRKISFQMYRKQFGFPAPMDLIRCTGNPPADWLKLESLEGVLIIIVVKL